MYLNLFKDVLQFIFSRENEDPFLPDIRALNSWCFENNINARKVREVLSTLRRVFNTCEKILNSDIRFGSKFKNENLFERIDPLLEDVYREQILMNIDGKYVSNSGNEYRISSLRIYDNDFPPPRLIALSTFEIVKRGRTLRFVSLYRSLSRKEESEESEEITFDELKTEFEFTPLEEEEEEIHFE